MLRKTKVKVQEPRIYGLGWLIGYVEVEKEVEELIQEQRPIKITILRKMAQPQR